MPPLLVCAGGGRGAVLRCSAAQVTCMRKTVKLALCVTVAHGSLRHPYPGHREDFISTSDKE